MPKKRSKPTKPVAVKNRVTIDTPLSSVCSIGVLVVSICKGGATTFIQKFTDDQYHPGNPKYFKTNKLKKCHAYIPYLCADEDDCVNFSVSFIDGGNMLENVSEIQQALSLLIDINRVFICKTTDRWSNTAWTDFYSTIRTLKDLGFKEDDMTILLTKSDVLSESAIDDIKCELKSNKFGEELNKRVTSDEFKIDLSNIDIHPVRIFDLDNIDAEFHDTLSDSMNNCLWNILLEMSSYKRLEDIKTRHLHQDYVTKLKYDIGKILSKVKHKKKDKKLKVNKQDARIVIQDRLERRLLLLGQTGSGKSAIINRVFREVIKGSMKLDGENSEEFKRKLDDVMQKSRKSIYSVTKECIRTNTFDIKSSNEGDYSEENKIICQLIDSIGFGDGDHSLFQVKSNLLNEIHKYLPTVNLFIFVMKIDQNLDQGTRELIKILKWVIETFKPKMHHLLFIYTHCDFYKTDYVNFLIRRLKLKYPILNKYMSEQNYICSSCPNLVDVDPIFRDFLENESTKTLKELIDHVVVSSDVIECGEIAENEFNKLKIEESTLVDKEVKI